MDDSYREFVETVRTKSDILALVSDYVELKKRGGKYWGCCPFHQEKTGSFSVTPEKGLFYCFGCHAGGDTISFIQKIENLSFVDAIVLMGEKMGLEPPRRQQSDAYAQKDRLAQDIYKINTLAVEYFSACLNKTKFGQHTSTYLAGRGINKETIEKFSLGAALPSRDAMYRAFLKRAADIDLMMKARLVTERGAGEHFDFFRSRLMIPIKDARGRVVGFGGRIMGEGQPKYLNSAESEWFNKRFLLYGLDLAMPNIKKLGSAIIVEGYMDAIALHSAGFSNAVASLGTAFSAQQAKLLARVAPEAVFCYDSDQAGRQATLRAVSMARAAGLKVKALTLPGSKDPDEFIAKNGAEAFSEMLKKAKTGFDFQKDYILSQTDFSSLAGKVEVVSNMLPIIAELKNAIEIKEHVSNLAQQLTIDEAAIQSELNKYLRGNKQSSEVVIAKLPAEKKSMLEKAELQLLGAAYKNPDIVSYIEKHLGGENFTDQENREIFSLLKRRLGENLLPEEIFSLLPDAAKARLSVILADDTVADFKTAEDCLKQIKKAVLEKKFKESSDKATEYARLGDSRYLQELAKSKDIKEEIKDLFS